MVPCSFFPDVPEGCHLLEDMTMKAPSKLRSTAFRGVVPMTVAASAGAQELTRKAGEADDPRES